MVTDGGGRPLPTPTRLRDIAVPVYGPTLLVSLGQGAILPLVALSARDLGAGVGLAAFFVALIGLAQLLGDLPAGALAARIGEQRALVAACVLDAVALLGAFLAPNLLLLGGAIAAFGLSGAVFSLARLAYLTEAIPVRLRARGMATLSGTFRVGLFVGPFVAAALIARWGIPAAYAFAALVSLVAAVVCAFLPDVTRQQRFHAAAADRPHRSVFAVVNEHRRVLLTLGVGVLAISAARSTRQSIVPLRADAQGVDAAAVSIIYGISAGVDMLLFYPGGVIMDRFGRAYVAVPAMLVLGLGFGLLPLTGAPPGITAVAALMGLGNGISAGVVMTRADAAPKADRAQFIGGWRLCNDLGATAGPLVVSVISTVAPLGAAALTMGVLTWAGAAWLVRWVPAYAVREQS